MTKLTGFALVTISLCTVWGGGRAAAIENHETGAVREEVFRYRRKARVN